MIHKKVIFAVTGSIVVTSIGCGTMETVSPSPSPRPKRTYSRPDGGESRGELRCPQCGRTFPSGTETCPYDGTPLDRSGK